MPRLTLALLMLCLPLVAAAADEGRFSYLEQEVRNLQRQVQALTRRVDDATTRPDRLAAPPRPTSTTAPAASTDWVDPGKWRKVRPGMSELDVISLLGTPTSLREVDGARVLFYAMEIGPSAFLSGSVRFHERAVSEVQVPRLQ